MQAHVLRAAAEHYGAFVTVTWIGNSIQVVDFLSSRPTNEVIILSFHGDERGLHLPSLGEDVSGAYPYGEAIRSTDFMEFLALNANVILNNACLGGTPEMAETFLSKGALAYVGAEGYPDTAASTKYALDFLYSYLIRIPGDIQQAHHAAHSEEDDRGMFRLYTR